MLERADEHFLREVFRFVEARHHTAHKAVDAVLVCVYKAAKGLVIIAPAALDERPFRRVIKVLPCVQTYRSRARLHLTTCFNAPRVAEFIVRYFVTGIGLGFRLSASGLRLPALNYALAPECRSLKSEKAAL